MLTKLKLMMALILAAFTLPAAAQDPSPMPDLSRVWSSSFGDMYWIGGYYSDRDKMIEGKLARKDGVWSFIGRWGRANDRTGVQWMGEVSFRFSADGQRFTGYYTSNGKSSPWSGRLKPNGAYSAGQNSMGNVSYNGPLEFQMRNANATGVQQEERRLKPTRRCSQEMINWLKRGGLSDPTVREFCRN